MEDVFSKEEERAEIGQTATYPIEYTSLPNDMHQFLQNIPHMTDLDEVYRYLEEGQFSDPVTQATLVYLKFCLQHAILLFNANYFPINDRTERDLCANVCRQMHLEKLIPKKRKIAANNQMEKQQNALVPDMRISYIKQEYAIIEAAKSKDDTKQINEGGKKCPELMAKIFDQLLEICPNEQQTIRVHGCLLSGLSCTPLGLSGPKGYIKLFKRGDTMQHPESSAVFKTRMCRLLAHFWILRLAIEAMCALMIKAENEQSEFA
ncbi:hypothetical protein PS15m_012183 [Mucor circinelloides]